MTGNRPPSILVVDDDVDTCRNLSDILTDLGYQVEMAHDGLTALEKVKGRLFDVAILDLKMPGMDGITLYREIRKVQSSAVGMIVTAFAGGGVAEQALAAGAWRILPKPVDLPLLLGLVQAAVDQPLVMVIDDDTELCSTLWDLLREQGFRVCVAHDEKEASDQIRSHAFSVVLIDMKLPGCDGSAIFRLVRTTVPEARTVLITGHREELDETIQRVLSEGADAVCYKPFDVPRLLTTLHKLTADRKEGP